jgi:hypothetical protein
MAKDRTQLPDGRWLLGETKETTYRIMSPTTPKQLAMLVRSWGESFQEKIENGEIVGFQSFHEKDNVKDE